jgi:hypothetical protein
MVTPQPKGFAVIVPKRIDRTLKRKIVTFADLKDSPGSWKISGIDRITTGELRFSSETTDVRHFSMKVGYKKWSVIAGSSEERKGELDIWQRKGGYAMAVNCPKVLVHAVASLLSLSIHGDLGGLSDKNLNKGDFLLIQKHALSIGGTMVVLHLRDVKVDEREMSVYNMTGRNIGNPEELIRAAKKVKRMGFRFPRLGDSEFHFWVADWGGGTLYQPSEFLPHHIIMLTRFFEQALS